MSSGEPTMQLGADLWREPTKIPLLSVSIVIFVILVISFPQPSPRGSSFLFSLLQSFTSVQDGKLTH